MMLIAVFLVTALSVSSLREEEGLQKLPSLGECGGANITYINRDTGLCQKPASFDDLRGALRHYWAKCSQAIGKPVKVTTKTTFKELPNATWQAMIPLDQGFVVSTKGKNTAKKFLQLDAHAPVELTGRKFRINIPNRKNTIVFTLHPEADDSFTQGLLACSFVQAYGLLPYSRVPERTYGVVNFQQWILSNPEEQRAQLELALETETSADRQAVAKVEAPNIALRSLGDSTQTEARQVVHLVSQTDFGHGSAFREAFEQFQSRYCPSVADCQGWILSAARDGTSLAFRKGFAEDKEKIGGIFEPEMVRFPSGSSKKERKTRVPALGWLPKGWVVMNEQIIHFDSIVDAPAIWNGTVLSVITDSTHIFGLDRKWKATPCTTSLRLDFHEQTIELSILDKRPTSQDANRPIDFLAQETYPECNVQVSITAEELSHLDLLAVRPN